MIKRQHVVRDFFSQAEAMRDALDVRLQDRYTQSINWHYFCDPKIYTYLRAEPREVFPQEIFERFMDRLRSWCVENLGLMPMQMPALNLMVNGCKLGLHSDFHNGTWGYVYSLTQWQSRKFFGGETLLMRDGVPSYKRHHVHGEVLYELIPAHFNQLLIFDDRIVHATTTIEGGMDPVEGRIALVGHIRAAPPVVTGALSSEQVRGAVSEAWGRLRDRIRKIQDVQGTITYRLEIGASGEVTSVHVLTDNLITPVTGYDPSESVRLVKSLLQQSVEELTFPATSGTSVVIVPVLVPLPNLSPIEFTVPHQSQCTALQEWIQNNLVLVDGLELKGTWDGDVLAVREPVDGSIRIESHGMMFRLDAPMWVPSQRESFERMLEQWAATAARTTKS